MHGLCRVRVGLVLHADVDSPDTARRRTRCTVRNVCRHDPSLESTMETASLQRAHVSAVAQIERALRSTLEDICSRVGTGAGQSTLAELVRHARELASLLDRAVNRLEADDDAESMRRSAGDLQVRLRALEQDLAGGVLH
jgi:hypothetical protein